MIITISRKPFKGSMIDHIEINGCGAINLDKCRIPTEGTISQRKGGGDARGQYGMKHTISVSYTHLTLPTSPKV